MFGILLRIELLRSLHNKTLAASLILLTVLVLLSAYSQARYFDLMVEDFTLRQPVPRIDAGGESIVLTRTPPPLLPFFNGVYENLPDEFRLRSDSVITNPLSSDLAPLDWLFPKIDLSFIVGVLLTLVAVLLAHRAIAEDREGGALKFTLANPINRSTVLAAKLTGVFLTLTVFLVYVTSLYLTTLLLSDRGMITLERTHFLALAGSTAAALIVLTATAALSAAISTATRRSSDSLAACAAVWIGAFLIGPSFGVYSASSLKTVAPVETAFREIALKEGDLIQAELLELRKAAVDLKSQNTNVETAWRQYIALRRKWMETRNQQVGALIRERKTQVSDQRRLARMFSLFSPYMAYRKILGNLCETGLENYDDFLSSVERYGHDEFLPASVELLSRRQPWRETALPMERLQLSPLQRSSPSLSQRIAEEGGTYSLLLLEIAIFLSIAIYNFNRYEVR
jgi:ABC-type transport system involved in multi-copper enzyme maturation permease subunit